MSRRRRFDGQQDDEYSNLTKFDEEFVKPTAAFGASSTPTFTGEAPNATGFAAPRQSFQQQQPLSAQPTQYGQFGGLYTQTPSFAPSAEQKTAAEPAVQTATATAERPMVFALRKYKDVFVYEYSDRFEYYNYTLNGMVRMNTEYKKR